MACAAPVSTTPLAAPLARASHVKPPFDALLLGPAPALSSGCESPSDRSMCIVPPCFIGALRKIPFPYDSRVLDAGPALIAVLIGTLSYARGGRVLVAWGWCDSSYSSSKWHWNISYNRCSWSRTVTNCTWLFFILFLFFFHPY